MDYKDIFLELERKIDWANALVILPNVSEGQRIADVSFAVMDVIDYCVDNGIIESDIDALPDPIEFKMQKAYNFLGGILW